MRNQDVNSAATIHLPNDCKQRRGSILRRTIGNKKSSRCIDSSNYNDEHFQCLTWHLEKGKGKLIEPKNLTSVETTNTNMNLLFEFCKGNATISLEAPLRHWNHRPRPRVADRTGDLLWPKDLDSFLGSLHC